MGELHPELDLIVKTLKEWGYHVPGDAFMQHTFVCFPRHCFGPIVITFTGWDWRITIDDDGTAITGHGYSQLVRAMATAKVQPFDSPYPEEEKRVTVEGHRGKPQPPTAATHPRPGAP